MSVTVVCTCMQAVVAAVCDGAEPSVPPAALEAAWKHDAAGDQTLTQQRFQESLAFFAAPCSSGDTAEALGACLADLLSRARAKEDQWRSLISSYEKTGPGGGKGGSEEGDDDLDMLLGADDEDEARPVGGAGGGKGPAGGGSAPGKASGHAAAPAAVANGGGAADDDDDAMSMGTGLGLSRATSHISISCGAAVPKAAKRDKDAGPRGQPSCKSLGGQLAAELSEASSGDDLPDDIDFDNPSAAPQHSHASPKAPAPSRQPLLKSLMASEEGKGHLADLPMDLRSWAKLKDQQQGTAMTSPARGPPMASPGRAQASFRQHGGGLVPLGQQQHNPGRSGSDASKAPAPGPGPAPPLLAAHTSGPKGNPLHNSIINSSATRQSVERQAHERSVAANVSPARQRSIGTTLSRKPSVSEPGPVGPQAEWQLKHLPALGHASRLYPAELRQASHGHLPRPAGLGGAGAGSGARAALEDKLPALPALAGSRGPPKAMEMMLRKSSHGSRIAEHNADHRAAAAGEGRLPGLGGAGGRGQGLMQLPQHRNSGLKLPSKRNLRGDLDF